MNKLYWIVCEENDKTLYEGRFLGRTRGAALKHLKEQLGRSNLTGLVFAITEIPVTLIRELVAECVSARDTEGQSPYGTSCLPQQRASEPKPKADNIVSGDFGRNGSQGELEITHDDPPPSGATTRNHSDYDWTSIKACYMEGRGPKDVAAIMNVPLNTLRGRITREGWARERREA
ncbi:hypothetical protein H5P28_05765 [Ruficoccus amylovorans]|uniref:Uncharacterized protein n=1 Tax=Ruficoccus amylovorans TaxID=1804625 RepID=A0A842HE03_9BACT|nr:hypothetical protein [Ruficoccus amylovorans]MBC2593764.1 hypothetical protein [Ruficoccus amylovorans]